MPGSRCQTVEDRKKWFKMTGELKWLYYMRLLEPPWNHVSQEDPEDTTFTKATRNVLVRGIPASLSLMVFLVCRPRIPAGEAVAKLELGL